LGAELSHHLGYPPSAEKPTEVSNQRNAANGKTVLTDEGALRIEVPRDRDGSFAPLLIPKHERRFAGFDDKIVAMYARGMTVREVQGFLSDKFGAEAAAAALDVFERGPWVQALPDGRGRVAVCLGSRHSVLRVRPGGASRHLHHERDRERSRAPAQDHQNPRSFPER